MNILNFTPHYVAFFKNDDISFDSTIRKWIVKDGVEPFLVIKSSGMLNAKIDTVPGPSINNIPTFHKKVVGCDPLPDGDSLIVVSALYAAAATKSGLDMSRVYTVADPVFSPDGRTVVGCRGICPAF